MAPCPLARAGDQYRDVRGRDFRGRYRPLGLALAWRARAALAKGLSLLLLGLWVLAGTVWMAAHGTLPAAGTMGAIGIAALVANLVCAVILWRRSEEHTSELQSLMRNSYAVFCLKKKKTNTTTRH